MLMHVNDDVLRNPVVSTVMSLLESVGVRFSRSDVRQHFSSRATYPCLTLADVADALDDWAIDCQSVEAGADSLDLLPLPAIVPLREEGGENPIVFVLVTSTNCEAVGIVHPVLGNVELGRSKFQSEWNGIALCVQAQKGHAISPPHALKEEAELARAYRASMMIVDDLVCEEDCAAIIAYCEDAGLFDESEVSIAGSGSVPSAMLRRSRTSSSAPLQEDGGGHVTRLRDAVARVLDVPHACFEVLQCARYLPGQEFRPHFDAGQSVPRSKTALVYLNDDFEGGATWFSELNYEVRPKQGSCLVFRNLDAEERLMPQSLHAGLAVLSGVKYVCNVWLRSDAGV